MCVMPDGVTFTEDIRAGVSTVTCDWCRATIAAELKHIRECHAEEA